MKQFAVHLVRRHRPHWDTIIRAYEPGSRRPRRWRYKYLATVEARSRHEAEVFVMSGGHKQ